jgi:hypothetical protein
LSQSIEESVSFVGEFQTTIGLITVRLPCG